MKTKDTDEIIPTKGVKGKTYYFKVALKVYDANGTLVAKTYLGQADYGYAKWTGKTVK